MHKVDPVKYAQNMRAALSGPDIYKADLTLNHEYFNTKKGYYWSQENIFALARGLKEYGVGEWKKINQQLFAGAKSEIELEMRTCLLLGCTDLSQYEGQKIDVTDSGKNKNNPGSPKKKVKKP